MARPSDIYDAFLFVARHSIQCEIRVDDLYALEEWSCRDGDEVTYGESWVRLDYTDIQSIKRWLGY